MGLKSVVLLLALAGCLIFTASSQGPKNIEAEPAFPPENWSGSQIITDVRESFSNESLFVVRKDTGMTPGIPDKGVRTPVMVVSGLGPAPAAGSWSFTLTDIATRYLTLSLYQVDSAVFGQGELIDGSLRIQVTSGGTVIGDRLALFVMPVGTQALYQLSMTIRPGSMAGNYVYSAQGLSPQPGVVFGNQVAPQMAAPQQAQLVQIPQPASN